LFALRVGGHGRSCSVEPAAVVGRAEPTAGVAGALVSAGASDSSTPARPQSRIVSHAQAICARIESGRPDDDPPADMKAHPIACGDSSPVFSGSHPWAEYRL